MQVRDPLQARRRGVDVFYYAFDLPYFDGYDLREVPLPEKSVTWVKPKVVAQVAFTEWTHDGKLRHPRFLGSRQDREPGEVRQEGAP
jgi:ATP-dependent DNA ligase